MASTLPPVPVTAPVSGSNGIATPPWVGFLRQILKVLAELQAGGSGSFTMPALTGDVTSSSGSTVTTVAAVGGSSAASVHAAQQSVSAATSVNTPSTLVQRDASGNFSAGTITASLNGNATSATTATTATSATTATTAGSATTAASATTATTAGSATTAGTATAPAAGSAHGAVTLDVSGAFQSVAPGAAGGYLRSSGTDFVRSAIQAADVPTLNQNTTGTAAGLSATLAIGSGGTGATTQQAALDALAGTQASGKYLRSDGTHTTLSTIQSGDVPTLNQNTTGSAVSFTGSLSGDVTGTQGATVVGNAAVIGKVLTGYVSGAGTVAATDSILQAIQKINGNDALKAPIASPTFTGTMTAAAAKVSGLTTAGPVSTDASGNLSSQATLPASQMPLPTSQAKTAGYTALATDTIVIMDCSTTGSFTTTLPSAATGRPIWITRKDASFTAANTATIARAGSDLIVDNGTTATTTTLATQNESVLLIPDGSASWFVASRNYPRTWSTYTMTWGGTTSAPTIPTSGVTVNIASFRREGAGMWIRYEYKQTATTGAAAGSGTYLFPIPSGFTMDTSNLGVLGDDASCIVGAASWKFGTSIYTAKVSILNSTKLIIEFLDVTAASNAWTAFASSTSSIAGQANIEFSFLVYVPISGWN